MATILSLFLSHDPEWSATRCNPQPSPFVSDPPWHQTGWTADSHEVALVWFSSDIPFVFVCHRFWFNFPFASLSCYLIDGVNIVNLLKQKYSWPYDVRTVWFWAVLLKFYVISLHICIHDRFIDSSSGWKVTLKDTDKTIEHQTKEKRC